MGTKMVIVRILLRFPDGKTVILTIPLYLGVELLFQQLPVIIL